MLIDTHCHINMMVKREFDRLLTQEEIISAEKIISQAAEHNVTQIINVGTSVSESENCVTLAKRYPTVFAAVGIHPNDCTENWKAEVAAIKKLANDKEINKIVAIGECGLDRHYPEYDLPRQIGVFKEQIEYALEHSLALIVHTRDAADETLTVLDEYRKNNLKGVIHCFSESLTFAQDAIGLGFVVGIGGTITYPKNEYLRDVCRQLPLEKIILETDAPFLPPQSIRGKQNQPDQIATVAAYLAQLRATTIDNIATVTTRTAQSVFGLPITSEIL